MQLIRIIRMTGIGLRWMRWAFSIASPISWKVAKIKRNVSSDFEDTMDLCMTSELIVFDLQ